MQLKPHTKTTLYLLIIIFILILIFFLIPNDEKYNLFPIVASLGLFFLILGIVLIIQAKQASGKLKIFLKLTGLSAIGPFIFSILHNLFYALAMNFNSLKLLFEILHVASFIIAVIITPLGFIISAIASIVLLKKAK